MFLLYAVACHFFFRAVYAKKRKYLLCVMVNNRRIFFYFSTILKQKRKRFIYKTVNEKVINSLSLTSSKMLPNGLSSNTSNRSFLLSDSHMQNVLAHVPVESTFCLPGPDVWCKQFLILQHSLANEAARKSLNIN